MIGNQCKYNKMIDCDFRGCSDCGWHPVVCARRLERIRAKYQERLVYPNT